VVVKVVAQSVNQIDGVVTRRCTRVTRKQDERDVSYVVAHFGIGVLQLHGWLLVAEQDLRGLLELTPTLLELLHEHLANDDVITILEHSAKYNCHSIFFFASTYIVSSSR